MRHKVLGVAGIDNPFGEKRKKERKG